LIVKLLLITNKFEVVLFVGAHHLQWALCAFFTGKLTGASYADFAFTLSAIAVSMKFGMQL
jgi:hypothetical protein